MAAAYSWRCRRGKAGHLPRRPGHGERGKRPASSRRRPCQVGGGQARRRLVGPGRGGAAVVLRGRESRSHGEGRQRIGSEGLTGQEVAGEYRRAVADRLRRRRRGYCGCRPSCTSGRTVILIVGSMICSTSSTTRRCSWWRGVGCGATSAHGRGRRHRVRRSTVTDVAGLARRVAGGSEGAAVRSAARAGADDPQGRWQAAPAGDRDRAGPCRASGPEAGAGADLRGGFPPVFLRVPPEAPGAGRDRRDPPVHAPARYEWVLEGDIEACFDKIDHTALMDRVRRRVGDKRVLALVKAFLKAGILGEDGFLRNTSTGTPQGGIVSPLLANIALSVLDDHFAEAWQTMSGTTYQRWKRRRQQGCRTIDWSASRTTSSCWFTAPELTPKRCGKTSRRFWRRWACACRRPRPGQPHRRGPRLPGLPHPAAAQARHRQARGLHLPVEEGPRGHHRPGPRADPTDSSSVARCPAAPAQSGAAGLVHLLQTRRLEGDLRLPRRVHMASSLPWIRRRYRKTKWAVLFRRFFENWRPTEDGIVLFQPQTVTVSRYRYRADEHPDTMGDDGSMITPQHWHRSVESPVRGDAHAGFGGRAGETRHSSEWWRAPARPDSSTHSTTAFSGGSRYSPTTSRTLASSSRVGGELERLGPPRLQPPLPPTSATVMLQAQIVGQQPGRPVRHPQPLRRRLQRRHHDLDLVDLRGRPGFGRSSSPPTPSAAYRRFHAITVGRDTPTRRRSRSSRPRRRPAARSAPAAPTRPGSTATASTTPAPHGARRHLHRHSQRHAP